MPRREATRATCGIVFNRSISMFIGLVVISLVASLGGCSGSGRTVRYDEATQLLVDACHGYANVIAVRIDSSSLNPEPVGRYQILHTRGTVIRSYKGVWHVGEPIAYVQAFESLPQGWQPPTNIDVVLCLNEHAGGPINIEVQEWRLDQQAQQALSREFHLKTQALATTRRSSSSPAASSD